MNMSDVPLTEKRFLEIINGFDKRFEAMDKRFEAIDKRFEAIDKRFENMDKRFDKIEKQLIDVRRFQIHEAEAIEYELGSVLRSFLMKKYPLTIITKFPMKELYDPITEERITELDAAFLVSPMKHKPDMRRLLEVGIKIPKMRNNIVHVHEETHLIIAEAKHHMSTNKIATKLWQFDRILDYFKHIHIIKSGATDWVVTEKFAMTYERNPYLAQITTIHFYFGAAFWQKGIADDLKNDIQKWKENVEMFESTTNSGEKLRIFNTILAIEMKWYRNTDRPKQQTSKLDMVPEEIVALKTIEGAFKHLDLILPSGDRYFVDDEKEIQGFVYNSGRKTRKMPK